MNKINLRIEGDYESGLFSMFLNELVKNGKFEYKNRYYEVYS